MTDIDPHMPVIVGVGEVVDRPASGIGREPARLMADALRAAEADSGGALLQRLDRLDTINEVSWPYADAAGRVAELLGIQPGATDNGPVGGESPMRHIHRAALRIQSGEIATAAVVGGEAQSSVRRAAREGHVPPWPAADAGTPGPRAGDAQRPVTRALEAAMPINVYPLYENATRAGWRLPFMEAQQESALLWAGLSAIAAGRDCAWSTRAFSPDEIATPTPDNRPIAWPYSKLMVANPLVNQGAAVILASHGAALAAGLDPARFVYILGGRAAAEPDDLLERESFTAAPAMAHVLDGMTSLAGDRGFDLVELYSCFPVVPKMARRYLGRAAAQPISVTGGLTFFGAPLNNYMTHAAVAMTQALRARKERSTGLLYGQGGYVTKHHALLLATFPGEGPLPDEHCVAPPRQCFDGPVEETYRGPAIVETYTVLFDRAGQPRHGIVIARTPSGGRTIARVSADHADQIAALLDIGREPVGRDGRIDFATDGVSEWRFGD
ncbi:MAG: acetyl-CoA acetyltransferase [Sphingobium sp.]